MNEKRYNQLVEDSRVKKIHDKSTHLFFKIKNGGDVFMLQYEHSPVNDYLNRDESERLTLIKYNPELTKLGIPNEKIIQNIDSFDLVLCNANEPFHARSFKLRMSTNKDVLYTEIVDLPGSGESYLSKSEKDGVRLQIS